MSTAAERIAVALIAFGQCPDCLARGCECLACYQLRMYLTKHPLVVGTDIAGTDTGATTAL